MTDLSNGVAQNNRIVRVEIGKQGARGMVFSVEGRKQETDTSLRIDFDVSYTPDGTPPKGSVTIFNAPKDLAKELRRDGDNFFRLSAGHGAADVIFAGRPVKKGINVKPKGSSGDWTIKIEALSGGKVYRDAIASFSIDGQIGFESFFRQVAADAQISVGTLDLTDAPKRLPNGVQYDGPHFRILDQMARMARAKLIFDGSAVHLLRTGVGVPPGLERVRRYSSENGTLIDQPTETDKGLDFRVLLDPGMRIGKQCQLKYLDPIEEVYVVRPVVAHQVGFKGSTHGTEFYTNVIGRIPRSNVTGTRTQQWSGTGVRTQIVIGVGGSAGSSVN